MTVIRPPEAVGGTERTAAPLASSVRVLLAVAAALVFLAGLQLFVFPHDTARYFAWTIDSPMTATFLGASYWSAIALELVAARSRTWHGARIAVPAVFVFTALTLGVTLWHLERFHLGAEHEARTQLVTWGWLAVYVVVPVAMLLAYVAQRRRSTLVPPSTGLPGVVRVLLVVQAAVLIGLGVALVVAPGWADGAWSWPLTPLTGRAVGAWLVGLGVGAAHACLVDDRDAVRPLAITGVVFVLLQVAALARFGDEVDWGAAPAWGLVAGLAVIGATSAWTLGARRR